MDIDLSETDGIQVLHVSGRMDASSVADFDGQWKKLLEDGAQRLVVDFSKLEYISSAGLRGVLMLAKTSRVKKARIVFAGMQSMVGDMFKLSGFSSILSTATDVESAVAMLK